MQLNPHLHFNGECEAAFKCYEQSLNGRITLQMPYEGTSVAEQGGGEDFLTGLTFRPIATRSRKVFCDNWPEGSRRGRTGISGLAQSGTVQMPLQETFWATRFGMLVDQFGIPWMIHCEKAG